MGSEGEEEEEDAPKREGSKTEWIYVRCHDATNVRKRERKRERETIRKTPNSYNIKDKNSKVRMHENA